MKNPTPEERTKACIRRLNAIIGERGWNPDEDSRIFGVKITKHTQLPQREGMIVFGPTTSEACHGFILGIMESQIHLGENEFINAEAVNLKSLCKSLKYDDFVTNELDTLTV